MTNKEEALRMALDALDANRRTHYYCEDTWYSCPQHEDGCANDSVGDECNCGADKVNAEIDKAITAIREVLAQPDENAALLAANKYLQVHLDVLTADYKKLSELCTNQGIRLMEAEDDLEQPEQHGDSMDQNQLAIFSVWFYRAPHRQKYKTDHPAYLAAQEAWKEWLNAPELPAITERKPLTDEMVKQMKESCTSMEMRGAFADGWLSAEAAHGITGESK